MRRSALLSECGRHRLWLRRDGLRSEGPEMVIVMLNPSTADAESDDPTIRRCVGYAIREGCRSLLVLNLYTHRTTNPHDLRTLGSKAKNHCRADETIQECLGSEDSRIVVFAWGGFPTPDGRDQEVVEMVRAIGVVPMCLGVTKTGRPRHPLYLPKEAPLGTFMQ